MPPENSIDPAAAKQSSGSVQGLLHRAFLRFTQYWFVWLPAVLLNVVLTIDYVVAEHNKSVYRATARPDALASLTQQDDKLSETLRAHWVATDDDGNLAGRISALSPVDSAAVPIEQLDVKLLQSGESVATSVTNGSGEFLLSSVEPGVYTLVAAGQNGFLAYAIHVLPNLKDFEDLNVDSDTTLDKSFYVSHLGIPKDAVVQDELQIDAAAVPPEFTTLERISQNYLPASEIVSIERDKDDKKAIDKATEIRGGFQFPLDNEGNFNGRIQPLATKDGQTAKLSDMNVFLIQDDLEVTRVAAEDNGKFKIEDIEPGIYSLVAAGKDGFAALSLELVDAQSAQSSTILPNDSDLRYASLRAPIEPESLGIAIVTDPADINAIKNEISRIANLRMNNAATQLAELTGQFGGFPGSTYPTNFAAQQAYSGGGGAAVSSRSGVAAAAITAAIVAGVVAASNSGDSDPVVQDPNPQSPFFVPGPILNLQN